MQNLAVYSCSSCVILKVVAGSIATYHVWLDAGVECSVVCRTEESEALDSSEKPGSARHSVPAGKNNARNCFFVDHLGRSEMHLALVWLSSTVSN